jgi:beta-glucanase (GH16 family)
MRISTKTPDATPTGSADGLRRLTTRAGRSGRRRDGRRVIVAAVAAVVVLAVLGGYVLHAAWSPGRWKRVWTDEFTGATGAPPSARNWLLSTGTSYPGAAAQWGTGEIETYTADLSNASLDGSGHLRITATRDASGGWSSARLETRRTDFEAPPGGQLKVQARIRLPDGGAGYWPAFWMLGEEFRGVYTNWPGVGEIDVMESKGSEPFTVNGTLHCGVTPGGPCNENNGISGAYRSPSGPLSAGFHTYAVEWDRRHPREEIRWYVDGHHYFTVHSTDIDAPTWDRATDHGFFLLLNLAIGGSFPGPTNANTRAGAAMTVDSVSVFRRDS